MCAPLQRMRSAFVCNHKFTTLITTGKCAADPRNRPEGPSEYRARSGDRVQSIHRLIPLQVTLVAKAASPWVRSVELRMYELKLCPQNNHKRHRPTRWKKIRNRITRRRRFSYPSSHDPYLSSPPRYILDRDPSLRMQAKLFFYHARKKKLLC